MVRTRCHGVVCWRHGKITALETKVDIGDVIRYNFGKGGYLGGTVSEKKAEDEVYSFGQTPDLSTSNQFSVDFVGAERFVLMLDPSSGGSGSGSWQFAIGVSEESNSGTEGVSAKVVVRWSTSGQDSLTLGAANFGASDNTSNPSSISWFFIEQKDEMLEAARALFQSKETEFKQENKLTFKKEKGDGWCGYRALATYFLSTAQRPKASFMATPADLKKVLGMLAIALHGAAVTMGDIYVSNVWSDEPSNIPEGAEIVVQDDENRPILATGYRRERNHERRRLHAREKYIADIKARADMMDMMGKASDAPLGFLSDRQFWMDASVDLQAVAHYKNRRCVLVVEGGTGITVFNPNCLSREVPFSGFQIEASDVAIRYKPDSAGGGTNAHYDSYI
jgi:hypothetical protein